MSQPAKPLPKVSAKHYPASAKVRFRIKGQTDGHVYQGQAIVKPCATCGTPRPSISPP